MHVCFNIGAAYFCPFTSLLLLQGISPSSGSFFSSIFCFIVVVLFIPLVLYRLLPLSLPMTKAVYISVLCLVCVQVDYARPSKGFQRIVVVNLIQPNPHQIHDRSVYHVKQHACHTHTHKNKKCENPFIQKNKIRSASKSKIFVDFPESVCVGACTSTI